MQKRYIIALYVIGLVLFATQVFAEYDQAAVKQAMQTNVGLLGEVTKAVKAKDFFTVAEKLMEIAKVFKSLKAITPVKASKEDWDRIHGQMIKAAFRGIGACADEDVDKLNAAIAELLKYRGEGHGMFR
jgi:hypothetical protein